MAGGSHNLIQGSILRNSGSVGAIIDGTDAGIENSEISYTGEGAIIVKGGNRPTLQKANNFVRNNKIHHFGHWVYGYKAGVKVTDVGQIISNNTLYQSPHVAIQWEGNEHLIEKNDIHDVTRFSSDAGAMYSGREWGWRGNVIRHNFIHDIHSWIGHGEFHVYGIYLDDALSGTTIFGNIFYDIQGFAILSGGGRDNIMENNIFANCGASLFADNRAVNSINFTPNHSWNFIGKLARDGIDYKAEPWASTYPELAEIPTTFAIQDPSVRWLHPEGSTFKQNISFGGTPHTQITNGIYDFDKVGSPGYSPISYFKEVSNNIDGQDPLFVNEGALDLNLQANSPAFSISGFQAIPFNQSGESLFLRKLVLGIPAQASGKNLTRPLLPSAPQPSCVHGTSPHLRKLGAGFVPLPQMTGRCFGKPFILSPPTLALRFRQNNGPTPTGDYQPSRSLSMAGSVGVQ